MGIVARNRTQDSLLQAAQAILLSEGIGGLNTNEIAKRAGVTPPTFYHYYKNKYALLRDLGEQLLQMQAEAIFSGDTKPITDKESLHMATQGAVQRLYGCTRDFPAARALLLALRSLPELTDIRQRYSLRLAQGLAKYCVKQGFVETADQMVLRCQLGHELAYCAVEFSVENDSLPADEIINHTADAICAVYNIF